jgi:hypothetical protein
LATQNQWDFTPVRRRWWGRRALAWGRLSTVLSVALLVIRTGVARADDLPSSADLDGVYITAGPLGAAVETNGAWFSGAGLELSVVHVRERALPAAYGVALGGISYIGRDGGRLWLELEAAIGQPLPFGVGLGVGPALDIGAERPTRLGGQATLWIFAGIVPYVRVGTIAETGGFFEAGVMIKIPARRFR